ncbi:hypothetical protein [Caldilinea sp.]|uniref:hypothetical protein n=1 Tax=Caldilinea sp. TaxID=2293560 RepID=UPI002B915870|nr:hypothetical protein [Caldilinea sp.]HRA65797.1 hypothetical protein [Caldilinea sp.]
MLGALLVALLLTSFGGGLLVSPLHHASAASPAALLRQGPDVLSGVVFTKTVIYAATLADAGAACQASTTTTVVAAAGDTVYYCYTISNASDQPVTLQTLFDDNGAAVVNWAPGAVLAPGETILPAVATGLVRPVTVPANATTDIIARAQWTVEQAGVLYLVESQAATTIDIVAPQVEAVLTVNGVSTTCPTTTGFAAPIANNAYGIANYCLTLRNRGNITLTNHLVSIPALGIVEGALVATLTPVQSSVGTQTISITHASLFQPSAAWTAALSQTVQHAALTVSAFVTSTDATGRLGASAVSVAKVTGSTGNILVTRYFAERPDQCFRDLEDAGSPGLSTYYCVVIQNTSATSETNPIAPLTTHELTDSATGGRVIIPNVTILSTERLTVTNQFLADRGLPQILGPVRYPQSGVFVSTSIVTSTNPTFGYRTSATSNSTSLTINTPQPDTPTPTYTPWPTFTPLPTFTPIPLPPTFTVEPTWTAAPTPTPSPTVVFITTPGGLPPTAYPQIGPGGVAAPTVDPFAPPPGGGDPFAQTATAAVLFGFVTPADPFAQTATAQAIFGAPPADPFAQTATAQALFGVPPADPFAQTATAQALFGVPPADPFAQTATAQALFGVPPADPFAQTATAQALFGPDSPLAPSTPGVVAVLPPPGVVITVTATPTSPGQRPVEGATPPTGDAAAIFRAIAGGAAAALALAGIVGGVVLFLLLAGALAGVSVGNPGPPPYDLVEDPGGDVAVQADLLGKPTAPRSPASPSQDEEEWPASLP